MAKKCNCPKNAEAVIKVAGVTIYVIPAEAAKTKKLKTQPPPECSLPGCVCNLVNGKWVVVCG